MASRLGKMPKEPKAKFAGNASKSKGRTVGVILPVELFELMRRAQLIERSQLGFRVTNTEFIARAVIDRIGKILGTRFAKRLYRAYFNGIGGIKPKIDFPEVREDKGLNIFIDENAKTTS